MGKKLLFAVTALGTVFLATNTVTSQFLSRALEDRGAEACQLTAEYRFLPKDFEPQITDQSTLENIHTFEATIADLEALIANGHSKEPDSLNRELDQYFDALRSAQGRYQSYLKYQDDCTRLTEEYQAKYGK